MPCSWFHLWLRGRLTNSAGSFFSPSFLVRRRLKALCYSTSRARYSCVCHISDALLIPEGGVCLSVWPCSHWCEEEGPLLLKHLRGRKKRVKTHLKDAKRVGKALQGQTIDPLLGVLPVFHIELHNFLWIVHLSLSLWPPCLLAFFLFLL